MTAYATSKLLWIKIGTSVQRVALRMFKRLSSVITVATNSRSPPINQRKSSVLQCGAAYVEDAELATAVEKLESLIKEIVELDERAHELGISKEEYALLNVAKKYLSNRSDSDLTAFVKKLDREIKTMLFPGCGER